MSTASPAKSPALEPYLLLFPIGAVYALLGASVWPLTLWAGLPYPGPLHSILMIEGFELGFVSGFLLTVMPRLMRTDVTDLRELPWVIAAIAGFGTAAVAGWTTVAHTCAVAVLLLLATAVVRRFSTRRNDPPEEVLFVPVGVALGLAGAVIQLAASAGWLEEPSYRLGLRLMSLGMVLSLVLGFGALLVPVFLEIKDPLLIPRVAKPHERPVRRLLYGSLAAALVLSFVAEAFGAQRPALFARALVGSIMLGWVWKIWRLPGRRTVPAFVMWTSGWMIGLGLWAAALIPTHPIAAFHVTLLGGFGVLTMAIASRVLVTHGSYGPAEESRVLTPWVAAALGTALIARLVAELDASRGPWWLALSASAWMASWLAWLVGARRYLWRGLRAGA